MVAEDVDTAGERQIERVEDSTGTSWDGIGVISVPHHLIVAKSLSKGTTLEGESEAIEKLNPLKVVLRAVPGIFANHQVRPCLPA